MKTFPSADTKALYNTHHNTISSVYFCKNTSSTSSLEYQHVASNKISYSSDYITSYPIYSFVFKVSKLSIGLNFSTNNLKDPSTSQNSATNSVISSITTPFLFIYIEPNYP